MLNLDSPTADYGLIIRLFSLVERLPRDQQMILLKQLVGDNVTAHLFKMIVGMSEDQRLILLEQLGHPPDSEPAERTLSLEGNESSSMRECPRKPCLIKADYRIRGRDFRSSILDISVGGVFIGTRDRFGFDEAVRLQFTLPDSSAPLAMTGKIAWSGQDGFGVKFDSLPSAQGRTIQSFLEKTE